MAKPGSDWLNRQAEKEVKRERLSISQRLGELFPMICTLIVFIFVAIHQTRPTGFFTGNVGLAAGSLYLMLVVGTVAPVVRLVFGRRNFARLFEVAGIIVFFGGQVYLLAKFPFDFPHFADPLPHSLEFLLDWVSATFAKVVLVLGILGSAVFAVYTSLLYRAVRTLLSKPTEQAPQPGQ